MLRFHCTAGFAHASSVSVGPPSTAPLKLAERQRELTSVLTSFPAVRHAFAYGSGIFVQPGLYSKDAGVQGPMLDFIFAVDNPVEWHTQNIDQNRRHYSFLASLGASAVACNAERLGAGVHFNAAVPWGSQRIKYGVIGTETLCRDLHKWDTMYAAGRLQKPVLHLKSASKVIEANERNLASALVASLLLLPKQFCTQDLCRMIVGLSYIGDVRMGVAEDSSKVARIATGSAASLRDLYLPSLQDELMVASAGIEQAAEERWQQASTLESRCKLVLQLPETVRERLAERVQMSRFAGISDPEKVAEAVVGSGQLPDLLKSSLASIVGPSSRGQAVAGAFMAGPTRSVSYVWQKMKKKWAMAEHS